MKGTIRKKRLTSFYIITFVFSILLFPLHLVFQSIGSYSVSFTQFSPALAVIFVVFILKDHTIVDDIKNQIHMDKVFVKWLIPAIAFPGILIILSSLILSYFKIDYVPWKGDLLFFALNFVAMLLGSIAEEIGWRGFLLPNLQKRHSPFISSIIVGILWGIWHLNFTGGLLGFVIYTVTIVEMSILMTWVYNKSNGNLLLMIVWHLVFNLASRAFLWERFSLQLFIVQSAVFGILCVLILIIDRKAFFSIKMAGKQAIR